MIKTAAGKGKRKQALHRKRNLYGYVFLSPFIIGLIVIFIPMFFRTIQFSFNDIVITEQSFRLDYTGTEFFNKILFIDPDYIRQLVTSLSELLTNTAIILIYSLFMATLLSREIPGRGIIRAIMFLPVIIATGIIDQIDTISASVTVDNLAATATAEQGLFSNFDIQSLIGSLQLSTGMIDIIASVINNMYAIITKSGVQLLIFLAGLQSISPAIYESATVEGATWWESFWKITFPMITPMLVVNTVYTVVDSFTSYSNVLMKRIYNLVLSGEYSVASAMSLIYFVIMIAILAVVVGLINRKVYYESR